MIFKLRKYKIGKGALAVIIVLLSVNCLRAQLIPNLGGQRTGTSSFQFLKIGTDARGTGMGETVVAVSDDISALSYNPAGIVLFTKTGDITHTQWFVDTGLKAPPEFSISEAMLWA